MEQPLVSVLIPMHNSAEYILTTIDKIFQQTYKNIEVVVVDDHSTDNSFEIVSAMRKDNLFVFRNEKQGGDAARNYAFKKSHGLIVKFMDADDYCTPSMIEKQVECLLERGTEDTCIFSSLKMVYPNEEPFEPVRTINKDFVPGIELLLEIWQGVGFNIPHSHLCYRSLVEKAGLWDEAVLKNQDAEFFARVYSKADKCLFVPNEYAIWVQREHSVSRNISEKALSSYISTFKIISKLILAYKDNANIRSAIANMYGYWVYKYFPFSEAIVQQTLSDLKELNIPFVLPQRRTLIVLKYLFGWRFALRIVHIFNL